jgi:hypothetical protein
MSNRPPTSRSMIGLKTALVLYAVLLIFAFATLKGTALAITLIIVVAIAVKTYLHHLRSRIQ